MKKKELEIFLQKIPLPKNPRPDLEQYMTPANIAADIIFTSHQFGDIYKKKIVDLGCGTGIFSIGSAYTGAKNVIGIDVDEELIKIAKNFAEENFLDIKFKHMDIKKVSEKADVVIMNPPFGAQKSNENADRFFLEKASEICSKIYSIHLKKTIPFIEKMIKSMGGKVDYRKEYKFPIKHMFSFHEKKVGYFDIELIKVEF